MTKPTTVDGYTLEMLERMRSACLTIATVLGDLMDEVVIVGGLAPALLLPPVAEDDPYGAHVGTGDVDVALSVTLMDEERYKMVSERLRRAGFVQDENEDGNKTRHRWRITRGERTATVDFVIQPLRGIKPGRIQSLEKDIGAIAMKGMHLAFQDVESVVVTGTTLDGDTAERTVKVCGAGAFVILKALAIVGRSENKDAYDLFMVLRNYGEGPASVAARLTTIREDPDVLEVLAILRSNFDKPSDVGPGRAARFLGRDSDPSLRQDVVGHVRQFLQAVRAKIPS